MKSTNAVRTEIHYAQIGEYQLPLLTMPQTDDSEPLGKYGWALCCITRRC